MAWSPPRSGGLLVLVLDGRAALVVAALGYVVAAMSGRLLPALEAPDVATSGRRARVVLPRRVRLAQVATAVVRLLNGFLLLLLAFAFKDIGGGVLDLGVVLGAGGAGFGLAALTSPPLERRLREEPMVVAGLAVEAAAAFVAGQWFGLPAAAFLAAAAGFAWGTAKLAFDGLLQAHVPATTRGAAFTRSETLFQLAWVLGALVPAGIPLPTGVGLVLAGLAGTGRPGGLRVEPAAAPAAAAAGHTAPVTSQTLPDSSSARRSPAPRSAIAWSTCSLSMSS